MYPKHNSTSIIQGQCVKSSQCFLIYSTFCYVQINRDSTSCIHVAFEPDTGPRNTKVNWGLRFTKQDFHFRIKSMAKKLTVPKRGH